MRPGVTRALRVLLLVVVGLGTLAQVASVPLRSDVETAVAQAQDGRVRTLQLYEGGSPSGFRVRIGPAPDRGRRLVWTDRRGLLHEAGLPSSSSSSSSSPSTDREPEQDLLATVVAAAPAGDRPRVVAPGALLRDRLAGVGNLGVLVLLVLLAVGPQPRRATKWGWAAYVVVLPLSLGALLLLLRDAPWSRSATALPEPEPRTAEPGVRTSGGRALLTAVAAALALGALSAAAVALVPGLGGAYERPAPYEVVREDGTRAPGPLLP